MRELSYIILQELGPCSLGIAQQVLYSNSDICVRIQVDQDVDTQQFRRLIQFLSVKRLKGIPKIIRFGQISGRTVLVINVQSGQPLRKVLQARKISSAKLDKWWIQMRDITSLLASQRLHLGTFTPDTLLISDSDELLIPIFSLGNNRCSESDCLDEIEKLFIVAVSQVTSMGSSSLPALIPKRSRVEFSSEAIERGQSITSSSSRPWLKGLRWLPTIALGIACLISFSRVSGWAESASTSSESTDLIINTATTLDSPELSTLSPESQHRDRGIAAARKILASDASVGKIDEEYAEKLLIALETIRDEGLNNLDYTEFIKVSVVGSPAADAEAKLFHNLLDSGYRLKKYKMRFSQVKILQKTREKLVIGAKISQEEFLKCADECVSITPEPSRFVKIVLVPKPWRIREILPKN